MMYLHVWLYLTTHLLDSPKPDPKSFISSMQWHLKQTPTINKHIALLQMKALETNTMLTGGATIHTAHDLIQNTMFTLQ